jgi:hypothetical protein
MRIAPLSLVLIILAGGEMAAQGPPFDFRADLGAIYPEIIDYPPFATWDGTHELARWGESPNVAGKETVFLQEAGPVTAGMLLVQVQKHATSPPKVIRHRELSAAEVSESYRSAETRFFGRGFAKEDIEAIIPLPDLDAPKPLTWQIRTVARASRTFTIPADGPVIEVDEAAEAAVSADAHECTPGSEDSESKNDLHHPDDASIIAAAAVANPARVHESAIRLCHRVFNDVRYRMVDLAERFTDADTRVLARKYGICDEKAVILVSYLRANRIPARVKFLRWMRKGKEQTHACVEYFHKQDNAWFHLDPAWDVIHNPAIYRTKKVDGEIPTRIKVVDVDWPDDDRSSTAIDNVVPDKASDGRLNPWGDFCYAPSIEGDPQRPGYSK